MTTLYQAPRQSPAAAAAAPIHGCQNKATELPRPKEISVNGVALDRDAIARETQNHPSAKPVDAWVSAARALVVRELLLQEAMRLHIQAEPAEDTEGRRETDEEAIIRTLVEQQVETPTATPAECLRFYEQNTRRFRSPDIHEVRHILFPASPADQGARDGAMARARAAIEVLSSHPHRFAELAGEMSACPSARSGGNLGQITSGQTVPEFEAAIERMQPGELSTSPIETRYGFHVVILDRRIEGRVVPFEVVEERIAEWLDEKVTRGALRQYVSLLAGAAVISGITLDANTSPLVQ